MIPAIPPSITYPSLQEKQFLMVDLDLLNVSLTVPMQWFAHVLHTVAEAGDGDIQLHE